MTLAGRGNLVGYALVALLLALATARFAGCAHGRAAQPARIAVAGARGSQAQRLYVHVAGAVRRPGLYRVPAGSRVAAALARAGGTSRRADPAGLNLAAPLEDGQQIVVPRRGAVAMPGAGAAATAAGTAATGAAGAGAPGAAPQVSLSTATPEQLDAIDGIGPALATRILQYRDGHGGFRSLGQLRQVEGIGDKRFEALSKVLRP